ncbi:MAG: DUF1987 domain-containing protein [Bacteroidia bacterium]|nr:DUF1987 domain-containing protein [Bacteroidia bacterium]
MKKLFIKETLNSPKVLFDPAKKRYEIAGKSFPENSRNFYQPVLDWFAELTEAEKSEKITLAFTFEYISSSSIITLKQMLAKIKSLKSKGWDIEVLWYYEQNDPDIKEIGEEYTKLIGLDIQMVSKT